jgi:hypothetical protein
MWTIPAELYLFRTGDDADAYLAYTNADREIEFAGKTFVPITITRGDVTSASNLDKARLSVDVPMSSEIAEVFRTTPPVFEISLVIYGGNRLTATESDGFSLVWTGRVLNCAREPQQKTGKAVLTCEPASTSIRRVGLRRHWQTGCPHVLYGTKCQANEAAATTTISVGDFFSPASDRITLTTGWNGATDPEKYLGGKVSWVGARGNEVRMILSLADGDTDTLILAGGAGDAEDAASLDVSLGCNHWVDDCETLHDNIVNYGGQPWIPTKNPVNKSMG